MKKTFLLSIFGVATATFLFCSPALAAGDFKAMANTLTPNITAFGPLIQIVFAIAGLVLCGMGLFQFLQSSRQPGMPKGPAFACMGIGLLLLCLTAFISMGSQSTFGSDAAGDALGKLGIK